MLSLKINHLRRQRAIKSRKIVVGEAKKKKKLSTIFTLLIESLNSISRRCWYKLELDFKHYNHINSHSHRKSSCCLNGICFKYSRHDHYPDIHVDVWGRNIVSMNLVNHGSYILMNPVPPPVTMIKDPIQQCMDLPTAAILGRRVYKLFNDKLMMFFLPRHARSAPSSWSLVSSSPSITSLFETCFPKLLAYNGRLYILGCKVDDDADDDKTIPSSESDSQFGLIFDPLSDSWDTIPMPCVENLLDQPCFSAAFIGGHLLLMLPQPLLLDTTSQQWRPVPPNIYSPRYGQWSSLTTHHHLNVSDIVTKLVEVDEDSVVYWITHDGRIYAHSLDTHKTRYGPIIGLEYTHFLDSLLDKTMEISLLHVIGDLFCLLYEDPMLESGTSLLHCLITRVIKLKSSIFMIVIGCICAPISGSCCFRNTFLM